MFDLKPVRSNGMAAVPTDWDIIYPYGQAMGLDAEDMQTLSLMCRGYFDALKEGENPLCIPPADRV